jgi:hypothetical protein
MKNKKFVTVLLFIGAIGCVVIGSAANIRAVQFALEGLDFMDMSYLSSMFLFIGGLFQLAVLALLISDMN